MDNSILTGIEVIDISEYEHKKVSTKKQRELIKKIWEIDSLICPECGAEMKKIALINDGNVIYEPNYDDFQYCPEEYPGEIKYG